MSKFVKQLGPVVASFLTVILGLTAGATCFYFLHQPEMPEEFNDFRKYAE